MEPLRAGVGRIENNMATKSQTKAVAMGVEGGGREIIHHCWISGAVGTSLGDYA